MPAHPHLLQEHKLGTRKQQAWAFLHSTPTSSSPAGLASPPRASPGLAPAPPPPPPLPPRFSQLVSSPGGADKLTHYQLNACLLQPACVLVPEEEAIHPPGTSAGEPLGLHACQLCSRLCCGRRCAQFVCTRPIPGAVAVIWTKCVIAPALV